MTPQKLALYSTLGFFSEGEMFFLLTTPLMGDPVVFFF
jgi:hypothetical protein